jgi:hypothetical protein
VHNGSEVTRDFKNRTRKKTFSAKNKNNMIKLIIFGTIIGLVGKHIRLFFKMLTF